MKKTSILIAMIVGLSINGWAMENHNTHGKELQMTGEMKSNETMASFKQEAVSKGLRAEFEVMTLASMGMKSKDGATHHIMVKFMNEKNHASVKKAKGKIKVISPSGKEEIIEMKDYQGVFAANLTFKDSGKYGVICLVKVDGEKYIFKFWYPHG